MNRTVRTPAPSAIGPALLALSCSFLACGPADLAGSGEPEESPDDIGELDQAVQCAAHWKSQFDGSPCGLVTHSSICGPTSLAMMRDAMTCGACSPTGGKVRTWYDHENGTSSCHTYTTGTGVGASADGLFKTINTLDQATWDTCPHYPVYDKCNNNYVIADLKRDLDPKVGYVAAVTGYQPNNPYWCNYFTGCHTIYVHSYNPTTGKFTVYDPDAKCHERPQSVPTYWTAAQLDAFSSSGSCFSNSTHVCAIIGKGVQKPDAGVAIRPDAAVASRPDAGAHPDAGAAAHDGGARDAGVLDEDAAGTSDAEEPLDAGAIDEPLDGAVDEAPDASEAPDADALPGADARITPVAVDAGASAVVSPSCGCSAAPARADLAGLLLALVALSPVRRRRRG